MGQDYITNSKLSLVLYKLALHIRLLVDFLCQHMLDNISGKLHDWSSIYSYLG